MKALLSDYLMNHDNKLPLTNDNDVDFEKILDHAKSFYQEIITFFNIPIRSKTDNDPDKLLFQK